MTNSASRLKFLEEMRKPCTLDYYQESLKSMSARDLDTVAFETGRVLKQLATNDLPFNKFPDLIEVRLKKIWNLD